MWGATCDCRWKGNKRCYFNPRPPCGGRRRTRRRIETVRRDFNPRPPCGGRLTAIRGESRNNHISIHAPRVGGDEFNPLINSKMQISIHAPRVGGDMAGVATYTNKNISIHAPRVGGDRAGWRKCRASEISIHAPRVGGDVWFINGGETEHDFNPRPPCGGRPFVLRSRSPVRADFNPRPPCGGRPARPRQRRHWALHFNPRPPCGGRRKNIGSGDSRWAISIHAPRVGGDCWTTSPAPPPEYFNPRPPCGGRRLVVAMIKSATNISIHAPRVGGDVYALQRMGGGAVFQSTPPVWGATSALMEVFKNSLYFNPRPPCGGRQVFLSYLQ